MSFQDIINGMVCFLFGYTVLSDLIRFGRNR